MKECMPTDKPLISILMAVYEPNLDWLREQLQSLESQTYPNLRLYICDDCSSSVPLSQIENCVRECIHSFPYEICSNRENLGSNRTFEWLTKEAEGSYFAYCDQDDIWLPEKLDVLLEANDRADALLACSDMYVIDRNGNRIASGITQIRRHHRFCSGEGLAQGLLISNFVTGCTMLLDSAVAKSAVPFCPYMVHDHYLALYAAAKGKIISLPERLISYRIHDRNQTSMMAGVKDKESYFRVRIQLMRKRMEWLRAAFPETPALTGEIEQALSWAKAREQNFRGDRRAKRELLRYCRFSPLTSLFEVLFAGTPECFFMFFVELKRRNLI